MVGQVDFNTLLVPVDFSHNSKTAFAQATWLVSGDNPVVILLHVIDSSLPKFAEAHDLGPRGEITHRMRKRAEAQLQEYVDASPDEIEVDSIISEGLPFLEILQKADDFAVDAIVMSRIGRRGKVEDLLFGSTAEKVLRGSSKPVLVLPPSD
ncbi:MAG: universal stress protein [Pirellulaceae bacterium]|jgi:nucleotide-binding universal stress UspA family protein|nr:universal stress protein [Pirellulaceae bacterium]MDP6556842.1 universal stress protein [Pirellulaceae bacterium]MDP6722539.1 universal stress protein [Pirellulaceae bacterium]